MRKLQTILFVFLLVAVASLGYVASRKDRDPKDRDPKDRDPSFGNIFSDKNAYATSTVYTSSTLTNGIATLLIPRATSTRFYGQVCLDHRATSTVWTYKTNTSTGVVVNQGNPIYPSSTAAAKTCARIGQDDPWLGQLWGIANVTTTVLVEYSQGLKE